MVSHTLFHAPSSDVLPLAKLLVAILLHCCLKPVGLANLFCGPACVSLDVAEPGKLNTRIACVACALRSSQLTLGQM